MKRRRQVSVFGVSFLDVMFCGFGSVILLVMIVNAETLERRKEVHQDLRGTVNQLEREVLTSEAVLNSLSDELARTIEQTETNTSRALSLRLQLSATENALTALSGETTAKIAHVNRLKADLKTLDSQTDALEAQKREAAKQGTNVRQFLGDGDRQYLTGLKVGGQRVLILVDQSASMLDDNIVNIIRVRNMQDAVKLRAPKWQQTIATVEWLVSQLPPQGSYQIYTFNTQANPVLAATGNTWLKANDSAVLDQMVGQLRQLIPTNGTSLHHAFAVVKQLNPRPDNIILLTDGLPTQGSSKPRRSTASGRERLQHFVNAVDTLPRGIPVNTILFPMEGDPLAASEFWKLAAITRGSFMSPAEDWP